MMFVLSLLGLALLQFVDVEKLAVPEPAAQILTAYQTRFDRLAWTAMNTAVEVRVRSQCLISTSCRRRSRGQPAMTLTAEGTLAETGEMPVQDSDGMAICTTRDRRSPAEIAAACELAAGQSFVGRDIAVASYHLGYARQNAGKFDEAMQAWDRAIAGDPSYAPPYIAKADWLVLRNDWGAALTLYRQAQKADKSNYDAVVGGARALAALGEHHTALAEYDRALSINPESVLANYYLGQYLERNDEFGYAAVAYERAARHFDPGNRSAGSGVVRIENPQIAAARAHYRNGAQAKALLAIDRAFAALPPDARTGLDLDLRAAILEKLGRFAEAADDLKLAIERLPAELDRPLEVRLAFALQQSGRKDEAAKSFEEQLDRGEKSAILRLQVFLRNRGYKQVRITGTADDATRSAVRECLADAACSSVMGQSI